MPSNQLAYRPMSDLPPEFIERIALIAGEARSAEILHYMQQATTPCFRVNTLKIQSNQLITQLEAMQIHPELLPHFSNAYLITETMRDKLTHSKPFAEGHVYLQNVSSMLPVICLDPQPGEEILDLTAAPGSKTTQIAALMKNQGRIAAVEKSKTRFFKLKDNLKRQGVTCAATYLKDGKWVWKHCTNQFDKVLLDAPCSSEGRFSTLDRASFAYWNTHKIKEMCRQQWPLLYSAFQCLKPGGTLVYSTCTFAPEENELIIQRLLKRFKEHAQLLPIELPINNIQHGLTQWNGKSLLPELSRTIRILPNDHMSGFYIAKITKMAEH